MQKPIVIASRRSPLAVAQAKAVRAMLGRAAGLPGDSWEAAFPIKTFVTTGDRALQGSLAEVGGKGLFVKEIEMALLTGDADIAVHSMKDMPAEMPDGLVQSAVPEREDPRDAFVSLTGTPIDELPDGAIIGTSSIRRAAQLRRMRPDVEIIEFRGNVQTRLAKLERGEALGTFLAQAGLNRLGRDDVRRCPIDTDEMLPALGQGALCIQSREGDEDVLSLCRSINHETTELTTAVERAFVARLDGSCRTPMAGHAHMDGGKIRFRAEILHPDGSSHVSHEEHFDTSDVTDALAKGARFADSLLAKTPEDLRRVIGQG
ncbi:hydroxymethylbilane synthase [Parvularcula lutaonensis]|uniref:Porphobilinogen deaminase n=1 Tax=Parvularcula lutaonensis TaxID=491923 RepID=A0ABV7MAY9_9PROT|nr:hydroxymethylbilane synthase [Parvularcula lutaonensis]GGY37369.1 porphobilinogen deaminase [Parvularcula lutaonensis]